MKKNLIISPTGNDTLVGEWVKGDYNFDLVLLCYDIENTPNFSTFSSYTPYIFSGKGEKWHLIKSFIQDNLNFISQYSYIWCPDDDILISSDNINKLFELANVYGLWICQPSMTGYVSHEITKPISNNLLRYTNFVEILAPLFNLDSLLKLYNTFDLTNSGWGYDWIWPHLLENPKDKIAIIDEITIEHTRPLGKNYSKERFPIPPNVEMDRLLNQYNINSNFITYSYISK
jgi:hypothetical protein